MGGNELYKKIARYYDLIYHNKDYEVETLQLMKIIKDNIANDGQKLLDIGCGTGSHIVHLSNQYDCLGMDINKEMLDIAKEKNPDVNLVQGDMTSFDLKEQFDVIISMFGTVGYCETIEILEKTFENVYRHLNPGGVFIFEPWLTPSGFKAGIPFLQYYDGDGVKVARVTSSEKEGNVSRIEMHFLIAETGSKVEHYSECT